MRRSLFIITSILASLFFLTACGGKTLPIEVTDTEFVPSRLTIEKGDTVSFINMSKDPRWPASNIHPTHEIYPEFDPQREIAPGESWSFTFDKKGIWRMHDHMFPEIKGVIEVK